MKIFHFIPVWSLGGAERVIEELINNSPQEVKTTILAFKIIDREDNCEKLTILKSGRLRKYFSFLKYILENKPNILHAHMTPTILHLIILRLFIRKIKIVYTVHGEYRKQDGLVFRFLDYIFYTKLNIKIICVSEFTYKSIKKYWDIPQIVIYNGINNKKNIPSTKVVDEIAMLKPTLFTKVFITIARIVPVKNLQLMVDAFKILKDKYDVLLLIIGYDPTPNQNELTKLKINLPENIIFLGPRLNGKEYLLVADAFCLTSITETLSMSILEAISCGAIVLTTNVGGVPEVILDKETGFLSSELTVKSYVNILKSYLSLNDENILRIKKNAYQHYKENFTSEKMAAQYMKIYRNGI